MLLKILLVGAVLIGAMVAIRNGTLLRDAGLLSSCAPAVVNGQPDPLLQSCIPGRLDGYPDLTNQSCTLAYVRKNHQYWRCTAPIVSSQIPKGNP
jgi:hypothetical protein